MGKNIKEKNVIIVAVGLSATILLSLMDGTL